MKTIISGDRCFQSELIDQAIEWLDSRKTGEYINEPYAIIIELIKGEE